MSDIQAFFNARQSDDQNARSIFSGIKGEESPEIISDVFEFLEAAGRDYGILRKPALVLDPFGGTEENGEICEAVREVENQFHLMRSHDGCVVSPKTVSKQYQPLTLMDIATEVQPWCEAGWCTPDSIFSGKGESLEIFCLRLDASGQLPNGEDWQHYIMLQNQHGVGGKAKGLFTSSRSRCSNTFGFLGGMQEITIGHRISGTLDDDQRAAEMTKRANLAVQAWEQADQYISEVTAKVNRWSEIFIDYAQAEILTDSLLGIPKGADLTERKYAQKRNAREGILQAFSMPQWGTSGATLYDWLNGVTFYLSSPNAPNIAKSKVSPVERIIRNTTKEGTGFKLGLAAQAIAQKFIAGTLDS